MKRVLCPHCEKPIIVRWQMPPPPRLTITVSKLDDSTPRAPLDERIMERLRAAGSRGMTVRELQQALRAKASHILDVLVYDLLKNARVMDHRDGKQMFYVAV
jgi:hypothetical protein